MEVLDSQPLELQCFLLGLSYPPCRRATYLSWGAGARSVWHI